MQLGIVTIAYNNYAKFLPQWCDSINGLTQPPSVVTVVLGKDNGITTEIRTQCLEQLPQLNFVKAKTSTSTMGNLRNVAVEYTSTEWIQYLSVDDIILPYAVEEYEKYVDSADFISVMWQSVATWKDDAPTLTHKPRLPEVMARERGGRGFVVNHSPYRRSFWERSPYMNHDYPNAPFVAGLVELGARFVATERPCTVYLRRIDSHCGKNLGRRKTKDGQRTVVLSEKQKARFWKADTERRIRAYYGVK